MAHTTTIPAPAKSVRLTGRIISIIVILFALFDAIMKIIKNHYSMEGSVALGWPASQVQFIGFVLLIATILYAIPRTAVLGAILITAYLGGAVAIMIRVAQPFWFPVLFGILTWAALYLQDNTIRGLIPVRKD
ncbi:DoxX family protein [Chitinophaga qingshengii]|uniref:DoxX family protein n=1 Tax=Chitinophaga qingshengii TaxID=1569794 RepID=A0ABR7TRX7_9BACT|nr:DoxX family protein [Chitinophaga qingshengii]MBC9933233.1 DoxX family protein [Chitinophaga qingshengii]